MGNANRQSGVASRRSLAAVALVSLVMALSYAAAELGPVGWDPAGVIAVGEDDPVRIRYAEEVFDRDIPLAGMLGHDGKYFFIQAMDPFFVEPQSHAKFLDRPTYRAQRMLYPTLAAMVSPFGPTAVAWGMIFVNVAAFVAGTVGTSLLATQYRLSPWWGLAFAANPGVRFELDIAGGGVVAMAGLMWGLVGLSRQRHRWAVAGFVVAVLAREAMLVAVVGAALAKGIGSIRRRLLIFGLPLAAVVVWWLYVHQRLGSLASGPAIQELGLPFVGFSGAAELWILDPGLDLLLGVTYLLVALLMVIRSARRRTLLELPAAGFGVLAVLLTRQVWFRHFDISRALSPMLTLFLLSLAASLFARPPHGSDVSKVSTQTVSSS